MQAPSHDGAAHAQRCPPGWVRLSQAESGPPSELWWLCRWLRCWHLWLCGTAPLCPCHDSNYNAHRRARTLLHRPAQWATTAPCCQRLHVQAEALNEHLDNCPSNVQSWCLLQMTAMHHCGQCFPSNSFTPLAILHGRAYSCTIADGTSQGFCMNTYSFHGTHLSPYAKQTTVLDTWSYK